MEINIKCESCGSTWKVFTKEGVSVEAQLMDCPICKKASV